MQLHGSASSPRPIYSTQSISHIMGTPGGGGGAPTGAESTSTADELYRFLDPRVHEAEALSCVVMALYCELHGPSRTAGPAGSVELAGPIRLSSYRSATVS